MPTHIQSNYNLPGTSTVLDYYQVPLSITRIRDTTSRTRVSRHCTKSNAVQNPYGITLGSTESRVRRSTAHFP